MWLIKIIIVPLCSIDDAMMELEMGGQPIPVIGNVSSPNTTIDERDICEALRTIVHLLQNIIRQLGAY